MAANGIMDRIGVIDLSQGSVAYEPLDAQLAADYLGGYGIGARFIYTRQKAGVDPLGPEAYLGFTTGILTGTGAITGNRFTVVGKSPKTGGWGDANCGGDFGPAMKMAGFDHLFIKGLAAEPVYILLDGGQAQILPAGELWGLTSSQTEEALLAKHGKKASVACIGPAGERVSLLACVMNQEGRAAGRSGLGAVMGAKKIKAVVAIRSQKVPVADPDALSALRKEVIAGYKAGNPGYDMFSKYGTAGVTANTVLSGDGPVKNWGGSADDFPTVDRISDDAVFALKTKPYGCWKCPVACGAHVQVKEGEHAGVNGHRPEYETLAAFGSMCLNDDLASIVVTNNLCNEYGMDTIAAGTTAAFAMELFEKGIISADDLGGLQLKWGDAQAVIAFTEALAKGEGKVYDLFGHGMKAAVEKIGPQAAPYATHCGGEELPMHDPRCKPGLGASYVIDATPGRHTQWSSWTVEDGFVPAGLNPPPIKDKYTYTGKGKAHKIASNFGHCVNMAGICWFATSLGPANHLPDALSHVSGRKFSLDDLQIIGARAAALRMAFNLREGYRNQDNDLPDRVLGKPPLKSGPTKGITVDNITEIEEYLAEMGWDARTWSPDAKVYKELGLDFVVD
jgi:aldehyde:ferredoxin oxidoreductase